MAVKEFRSNIMAVLLPVNFAIYPIVFLFSNYVGDVYLVDTLRSLAVSIIATLVISITVKWITGDWKKSALITTLLIILHTTYGHLYNILIQYYFGTLFLGKHQILFPLWILTLVFGSLTIVRRKKIAPEAVKILNAVALGLIFFVIVQIGDRAVKYHKLLAETPLQPVPVLEDRIIAANQERATLSPDIYYIVLDSYSREDALLQDFKFENSAFLDTLREKGFTIPECTQSNYANTAMSLSTALHMNYLDTFSLSPIRGDTLRNFVVYKQFLLDNPVRRNFDKLGYQWITFETDYWWADVNNSDIFMMTNNNLLNRLRRFFLMNAFEDKLLTTTSFIAAVGIYPDWSEEAGLHILSDNKRHHRMVVSEIDQLEESIYIQGPKFVFAHIVAPHVPFVFTPDGEYQVHLDEGRGYLDAIEYVNHRVVEIVDQILENSSVAPIIIIQGDHGLMPFNRMKILNAYYLPGDGEKVIHSSITPVNTFRAIFDHYFFGNYGGVPDKSYYSSDLTPYQFFNTPTSCVNH